MPRHVARYFMRRRHHRRRIPAASRYISGCTVNPSSPAVRQLHRGRSSKFRERSSSSARLLSPSLILAVLCMCACVCVYVYAYVFVSDRVSSLLLLAVVTRVRLSSSLSTPLPYRGPFALPPPVVRGFFSFLSSFHGQGPRYSRFRRSPIARRLGRYIVLGSRERNSRTTVIRTTIQLLDILIFSLLNFAHKRLRKDSVPFIILYLWECPPK